MLSEKIRRLRKQARMSQEQLAEQLAVSRQAVTKWETGNGVPGIENLRALSDLFCVSIDELLENCEAEKPEREFLFDSVTEYDIDCPKHYDISFAGAYRVTLVGYAGEKLGVRLASQRISEIQSAFKVKIDDVQGRIDVDVRRFGDMSETEAKAALEIFIRFPQQYLKSIELSGNTKTLLVQDLVLDRMEFSGKVQGVLLHEVFGQVELDSNEDMEIQCDSLHDRLDVNQIASTSKLSLPEGTPVVATACGIATRILYEKNGKPIANFSLKGDAAATCRNRVELNGLKSELIVNAISAPVEK